MIPRANELPLSKDASSRFLPWIIGFMVYVAVLAFAATILLNTAAGRWRQGMSGVVTVQIMPSATGSGLSQEERTEATLRILGETDGIAEARVLPREEVNRLLEPWLGSGVVEGDLPLPRLIDVTLRKGKTVDTRALGARLAADVPGTIVDDHGIWLSRLVTFTWAIQGIAGAVMLLIAAAAAVTITFTTRTGLAIHNDVVELLHLIGARDRYIARAFELEALRLGLKGGIGGFLIAAATLAAIGYLAQRLGGGLLPDLTLGVADWARLFLLPLLTGTLCMVTARMTVLRTLGRML